MHEIALRAWREPAVAIGLLTTVLLAIVVLATGDPWDTAAIVGVLAPLASALGIRELVVPVAEPPEFKRLDVEPSVEAQQIKEFDDKS